MNNNATITEGSQGVAPKDAAKQLYPKPSLKDRLTHKGVRHTFDSTPHTQADLDLAYQSGKFPYRPSPLFLTMFGDVLKSIEGHPLGGAVSPSLLGTSGVAVQSMLSSTIDCLTHYRECMLGAQQEIMLAAGFWKNGKDVQSLHDTLIELDKVVGQRGGNKIVIKIMFDRGWPRNTAHFRHVVSDKTREKLMIPDFLTPNLIIEVLNNHRPILGTLHTKYLIVDRTHLILSSFNIQDKKNLELSAHFRGEIVNSFYDTFLLAWGEAFDPQPPCIASPAVNLSDAGFRSPAEVAANRANPDQFNMTWYHNQHAPVPMAIVNRPPYGAPGNPSSALSNPQDAAWLSAFAHAQHTIFIQTPDFNAKPAKQGLIDACQRGVIVTVWLCYGYNDLKENIPGQGKDNVKNMKKVYAKLKALGCAQNFRLFWFVAKDKERPVIKEKMCHVKFMGVDGQVVILGSGNMDTQSWYHSAEVNCMVDSVDLCSEWMTFLHRNENTHKFGAIDPNSPISPADQMDQLLKKKEKK